MENKKTSSSPVRVTSVSPKSPEDKFLWKEGLRQNAKISSLTSKAGITHIDSLKYMARRLKKNKHLTYKCKTFILLQFCIEVLKINFFSSAEKLWIKWDASNFFSSTEKADLKDYYSLTEKTETNVWKQHLNLKNMKEIGTERNDAWFQKQVSSKHTSRISLTYF